MHQRYLEDFDWFIEDNSIVPDVGEWELTLRGELRCRGGLALGVYKVLAVNARHQVLGLDYSYHARVPGRNDQPVFRYDNSHVHTDLKYPDAYHKHVFSPFTGREERIDWIGRAYWPFMNEIFEELHDWWVRHAEHLGLRKWS